MGSRATPDWRFASLVIGLLLITPPSRSWAAKAPLTFEELLAQSLCIVSGEVIDVTHRNRTSKAEKAWGIHRDRVFSIKVRVTTVLRGTDLDAGNAIEVVAWRPILRIPPLPGLQGHTTIPEKGDSITVYVKKREGAVFHPILPNGIVIKKGIEGLRR